MTLVADQERRRVGEEPDPWRGWGEIASCGEGVVFYQTAGFEGTGDEVFFAGAV